MGELIITIVPQPAGNTEYKFDEVDTNLLTLDGNFTTFTQSYYVDSASFDYRINQVSGSLIGTSSFATTGSNYFNGNQIITGSLANGLDIASLGTYAHAEGRFTTASGPYAHAEGYRTAAVGNESHAEGLQTYANGDYSHAEGYRTIADSAGAHAEGDSTSAIGQYSHTEGYNTKASGSYSHAEGQDTTTIGNYSHAEGIGTIASGSGQTVAGKYNRHNNTSSLFIIGNGTDDSNRSDLVLFNSNSVELSGSLTISGSLFVNGQSIQDLNIFITTSSFNSFTSSYYLDSASFDYRIKNISIDTSSFVLTSSFNTYTASVNTTFAKINGGNSFTGDQRITDGVVQLDSGSTQIILGNGNITSTNGFVQLDSGSKQIKLTNDNIRVSNTSNLYTQVGTGNIQVYDAGESITTNISSSINIKKTLGSSTTIANDGVTTDGKVTSPLYLGSSFKTECPDGSDTIILTYPQSTYSAFVIDGYVSVPTSASYYGLHNVFIVKEPSSDQYLTTSTWPFTSPSASRNDKEGRPEFFTSSLFYVYAELGGSEVKIFVSNNTGYGIDYKTIVKSYTI